MRTAIAVLFIGLVFSPACGGDDPAPPPAGSPSAPDASPPRAGDDASAPPAIDAATPADAAAPRDAADAAVQQHPAYWVDGADLRDPCGEEVVLRGVNKMAVFLDRAGDSFPEIALTGANAVRFMWVTSVAASEAAPALQRAVDSKLLPIWEMHDATGDWSKMGVIEKYWTDPATVKVLRQFEANILVNLANEAGTQVADDDWVATYGRIVGELRAQGLRMPFVIDAAGYGRDESQLLRLAPRVLAADPMKNVMFSWHVYDAGADVPGRIDAAFQTATSQHLPLLVGEFGPVDPGACSQQVPYQHLIAQAQAFGRGYLPWSWDDQNGGCGAGGNGSSDFDMVTDGIHFSTLKPGYATTVVVSDPASIQKTSKRTAWMTTHRCEP